MEVYSVRPLLAPAVSLVCAILVFLTGKSTFWRRFWSLGAATIKFGIIISMLPAALRGTIFFTQLVPFTPGISINFRVDPFGLFFSLVSSALWIVTTIYAIGYMEPEHAKVRFFGFFAICVSSTVGIAFAGNLFTLFIFYELLTIATYPLVIHEETPEAMKAGRKYLIYTLTGGTIILLCIAFTFYLSGTLTLSKTGVFSKEVIAQNSQILILLFAAFIIGFGVKSAIMPLHGWLPTAMVAPTPVSALLHAVAVVKAGVFGISRVIYNVFGLTLVKQLGVGMILAYIAAFTIIAGSILALLQDNLKRRLAYSTVSQLSYIVMGAALGTPAAVTGSIIHMANQAFQKITMFFVAGSIERKTGKKEISQMVGIGHKMPITMATFTIAALGFIGIPLFAGFITKWYLCLGSLEAGTFFFLMIMLASSLLNASYWLPIVYAAYFKEPLDGDKRVDEAHWTMLYPCIFCAIYVIALGTFAEIPGLPLSLARTFVRLIFK
jgi:multicomponent Na+:H+ antiporter subunit D